MQAIDAKMDVCLGLLLNLYLWNVDTDHLSGIPLYAISESASCQLHSFFASHNTHCFGSGVEHAAV